jgi:O-antigen/teichoic acid export membrane protein
MSEDVNHVLHRVVGGTGILLVGAAASMLFGLASRILIARHFTQSDYGVYALALIVVNMTVLISALGFQQGLARQIGHHRGKGEGSQVGVLVGSALLLGLALAVVLSLSLFVASDLISLGLFHEPALASALKIVSVAIPFTVLIALLGSSFRGIGRVAPVVYFRDLVKAGLFPALLGIVVLLGLPFPYALAGLSVSSVVAALGFLVYTRGRLPISSPVSVQASQVRRQLLLFSLPLLGLGMLSMLVHWTDSLMLGYFRGAGSVGLYNSAVPLARLIPMLLSTTGLVYLPLASELHGQDRLDALARTYQVLTKWVFSLALPLFSVLVLFPRTVLSFFFGVGYGQAATALQILSGGFIFHVFVGLTGITLVALGKSRLPMFTGIVTAGSNVALNLALIPRWGIMGAAVASLVSYVLGNTLNSVMLYRLFGIHPFTRNYLRPIASCGAIVALIYLITRSVVVTAWWALPLLFGLFLGVYGTALVLTRSFDGEDIAMLLAIERRLGVDLRVAKRMLRRFV